MTDRRIDVQWHKNGKALDLVVEHMHCTVTASEVQRIIDAGTAALAQPPSNATLDIDAARAKLGKDRPPTGSAGVREPRRPRKPSPVTSVAKEVPVS